MNIPDHSHYPSFATRRTWREDAIVLGALVLILGFGVHLFSLSAPSEPVDPPVTTSEDPDPLPDPKDVPNQPDEPEEPAPYVENNPAEMPLKATQLIPTQPAFITLFGAYVPEQMWYLADHDVPEGFWRNDFRERNIVTGADGLSLSITSKSGRRSARPWNGSEITTRNTYGYGRYEVVMSPARGSGLISSFFTFTGSYFGTPHDEIDIEFLGKDTRRVELNMYTNDRSQGAKVIDLPFDAADGLHLYAFEWWPDEVIWFVDGVEVHRVTSERYEIPKHSGKIMMNLWTGKMPDWHGRADFESGVTADYACVSYRPFGSQSRSCSDFYQPQMLYRQALAPS